MNYNSYSCLGENETGLHNKPESNVTDGPQIDKCNYQTVPQAVITGNKLRTEKFKAYIVQPECDVSKFYYNNNCYYNGSLRSAFQKQKSTKTSQWSPKLSFLHHNQNTSCPTYKSSLKPSKKCPLRIVELAVPDKRQCIETWKNKCEVLPGIMIDRLKQHVMDERPIVTIPDALNNFQRKRSRNLDYISLKKLSPGEIRKYKRLGHLKELSALFGQKIAAKLKAPLNVNLNADLQKIADIVSRDIKVLVGKKIDMAKRKNKVVLEEISGKVAVWIASIIEESSYKVLEEELQVKKRLEKSLDNRELITIIQNILGLDQKITSELEEEVGPVFDVLDKLIDNVVSISETNNKNKEELNKKTSDISQMIVKNQFDSSTTEKLYSSEYDTGESNITLNKSINTNVSEQNTEQKRTSLNDSETNLTISEDIKTAMEKELEDIVQHIFDNESYKSLENKEGYEGKHESLESINKHILIPDETDNDIKSETSLSKSVNEITLEDNIEALSPSKTSNDLNEENKDVTLSLEEMSSSEHSNTNVSAMVEGIAGEYTDDKFKTVKFSENSIDPTITLVKDQQLEPNDLMKKQEIENEMLSLQLFSNLSKQNLTFAVSDEKLLRNFDEHWPEELLVSSVKIVENISKSVTSLGNIDENDESVPESPHLRLDQLSAKDLLPKLKEKIAENQEFCKYEESSKGKDKKYNAMFNNNTDIEYLISDDETTGIKDFSTDRFDEQITVTTNLEHTVATKLKLENSIDITSQVGKGDQADQNVNLIYNTVTNKLKQIETKFDYKIYPSTAPPWVKGDSGEPSVDSLQVKARRQKDSTIRQSCKTMQHVTEDLDMWTKWISNMCHSIRSIKKSARRYETGEDIKKNANDWMNLKKNIDDDIEFWKKLHRRHERRLKCNHLQKYSHQENIQCNRFTQKDSCILELIKEIETNFSWMHRTIVSTQYAFACNCKNNK